MSALQISHQNSLKVSNCISLKIIKSLRNFYLFNKKIRLLIAFLMLAPAVGFCQQIDSLNFNPQDGTIHIRLLHTKREVNNSNYSYFAHLTLFYTSDGFNYFKFYERDDYSHHDDTTDITPTLHVFEYTLTPLPLHNDDTYFYDCQDLNIFLNNNVPNIKNILITGIIIRNGGNNDTDYRG